MATVSNDPSQLPICFQSNYTGHFFSPNSNNTFHPGDSVSLSWFGSRQFIAKASTPQWWKLVLQPSDSELPSPLTTILDGTDVPSRFDFGTAKGSPTDAGFKNWAGLGDECGDTTINYVWSIPKNLNLTSGLNYRLLAYNMTAEVTHTVGGGAVPYTSDVFKITALEATNTTNSVTNGPPIIIPIPTPSESYTASPEPGKQIPVAAKAGIGVGIILVFCVVAAWLVMKWRQRNRLLPPYPELDGATVLEMGGKCNEVFKAELATVKDPVEIGGSRMKPAELYGSSVAGTDVSLPELEAPTQVVKVGHKGDGG